ncbi:MAG: prepilin-type N-terminal cleavage/methylation domain-containing protein [Verrucomicrobiota bacterium]|nr:prepilin-type N-terminal cleavage/methylation domain-containing protein [Verrucomicrobiota bacterium]
MFIEVVRRERRRGFTLLEIMLAVGILAMMSLAIYRFVQTNITALRISSEVNVVDAQYSGFANLLTAQFQSLPTGDGALLGEPFKFNDRPRDEITWICSAGAGLMTRYAKGEYKVSLRLRPISKESDKMEIGLERRPRDEADSSAENQTWVPLLPNVQSLQIRYFDPRLNTWVDRWTDTVAMPRLVRIVITRPNESTPWEVIVPLARTPL